MATTTILLLLIVLHLRAAAASAQRVALPGCRDRCGNVTVVYPFGIGAGCYRDAGQQGFQLECDDDGPGSSPPRLAVFGYNHRLGALSLAAGEARAYLNATRECYNSTGGLLDRKDTYMSLGTSPYLFSSTKNRLVALGCPNLGYFVDAAGYYVSGCMAVCGPQHFIELGSCTGVA